MDFVWVVTDWIDTDEWSKEWVVCVYLHEETAELHAGLLNGKLKGWIHREDRDVIVEEIRRTLDKDVAEDAKGWHNTVGYDVTKTPVRHHPDDYQDRIDQA